MTPVQGAVVQRRDVPRAVALEYELGDFASFFAHHVVGAGLRHGIHEPAPAAGVVALTGVDDHHVNRARRIGRPLVKIGGWPPHRGRVVGRSGRRRRGAGARCGGRHEPRPGPRADEGSVHCARVRRASLGELDAAVAGHDGRPGVDACAVDPGFARVQVEQGGRGTDVREGIVTWRLERDSRECRSALERRAAQCHDAECRRPAGKLFFPFHHLPARLHPGKSREQLRRHVKLGAGRPERGIERRRSGGRRRDGGRELSGGTGLHRGLTAGGKQDDQREDRLAHGPCFTSSSRRAGPVSSVTR